MIGWRRREQLVAFHRVAMRQKLALLPGRKRHGRIAQETAAENPVAQAIMASRNCRTPRSPGDVSGRRGSGSWLPRAQADRDPLIGCLSFLVARNSMGAGCWQSRSRYADRVPQAFWTRATSCARDNVCRSGRRPIEADGGATKANNSDQVMGPRTPSDTKAAVKQDANNPL